MALQRSLSPCFSSTWHLEGERRLSFSTATADAILELSGEDGREIIQAESDGNYRIRNVIVGKRYCLSFADEFLKKTLYRFISLSNAGFKPMIEGYDFVPDPDKLHLSLGLTVGPLTLPFPKSAKVRGEPYYVDLDPSPKMKDWEGGSRVGHDNHLGVDYDMPEGQMILAAAPGVVIEAEGNWPNVPKDPNLGLWDDGNRVTINHGRVPPYGRDFYTIYCHLRKVVCSVGQKVGRGQKIAESRNTGYKSAGPHTQFIPDPEGDIPSFEILAC